MAIKEIGRFETASASKYLQQLCKHFSHKVKTEYDTEKGVAHLGMGPAYMTADEAALTIEISAPDEGALKTARHVIDAHLERFAFREEFKGFDWKAA